MDPLPLNPKEKINYHIDTIFGTKVCYDQRKDIEFKYSRRTGRIKNFSIKNQVVATLRTDGGLALTILGAKELLNNKQFRQNCIIPMEIAIPFVSEGRSLFCKHVEWSGSNIKVGSDVAIIDKNGRVLAVGRALISSIHMKMYYKGIAVKVREGIKSRLK